MSRSYQKVLSHLSEIWVDKSFRRRNRLCIHREIKNPEYGDVVYPVQKEYFEISRYKNFDLKQEIRNKYFLEIRNILNGYAYRYSAQADEIFIYFCDRIKGLTPDDGRKYEYEWLNSKKVRNAIKTWAGEPLNVLKYLTDNGFIEEAVRREFKLTTRK